MLLQLYETLDNYKNTSTRRAAILKVEENNKTHLALIKPYLEAKYKTVNLNLETLQKVQTQRLIEDIAIKPTHGKLFRAKRNEMVDIKDSSIWLHKGSNKPTTEAYNCYVQDRNVYWNSKEVMCLHCNKTKRTVDHIATKCDRMLGHDYTRRHNEVVRAIHLHCMNLYGFTKSKKIRSHSVQEVIENRNAEVRVDTRIKTDILIKNNSPDIFIYDKKKNEITIIEVGITCQDLLQQVEIEKKRKYDLLANELGMIYKCRTKIVPYVMTWDGVVTRHHKRYVKELKIPTNLEAYLQSLVIKKTLETISLETRRSIEEGLSRYDAAEDAVKRIGDEALNFTVV